MATFMDILAGFFNISPELISKYAMQGPIYQIFYLFFFPSLFILLFIYILTSRGILGLHKGIKLLVSVAVYAFIILNGWYDYFVRASEFWMFMLIILGVVYFFWARGGTRGGAVAQAGGQGGAPKGRSVFSSLGSQLANRLKKSATHEIQDQERMINDYLKALKNLVTQYKKASSGHGRAMDAGNIMREWGSLFSQTQNAIQQYRESIQVGGFATGSRLKKFQDELSSIVKEWESAQR